MGQNIMLLLPGFEYWFNGPGATVWTGAWFCGHPLITLSMMWYVGQMVGHCFHQLRLITSCIKSLPYEAAWFHGRLLRHLADWLLQQSVGRRLSISSTYYNRYWLWQWCWSVTGGDSITSNCSFVTFFTGSLYRVEFKLCLLVYKVLHEAATEYLRDYLMGMPSPKTGLWLRSHKDDFSVRRTRTQFGNLAFWAASSRCFNSLPSMIRSGVSIESFKAKFQT